MKYIKVTNKIYRSPNTQTLETDYVGGHIDSRWVNARPELLSPNLKEWFMHAILRKHISFGQPYCVICGKAEFVAPPPETL